MTPTTPVPDFDQLLPNARYRELHTRTIDAPIDQVWPHCVNVTGKQVRLLQPLMSLRTVPHRLAGKKPLLPADDQTLLDGFVDAGFVVLRQDDAVVDGRASIVFGAAGAFWSIAHNHPLPFADPADFVAFAEPGYAKTIARLDAIDLGNGTTLLETETLVHGTDAASTKKFGPYWAIIRLGSGAIRRSWLAAIARRVGA